jgi:hypothetical protein
MVAILEMEIQPLMLVMLLLVMVQAVVVEVILEMVDKVMAELKKVAQDLLELFMF